MKVYVVLKSIFNRRNGWSIGSDRIEKIFDNREKAEEYVSSEEEKSIPGYYYKSIYTILEHDVVFEMLEAQTLEQEKCEVLGIIQGKDKAIQELKKENTGLKTRWQCRNKYMCSENGKTVPCYTHYDCLNCHYKSE